MKTRQLLAVSTLTALAFALQPVGSQASPGSGGDRPERASDNAVRDAERAAERAAADMDRNRIRAEQDQVREAADAQRAAARAESDAAEARTRAAEDAAEAAARAARDAARAAEDALEEAARAAEETAEEAAEAAEEAAEEASRHGSHSAETLRTLVAQENPEFDPEGFPVRRAEVAALDISPATLRLAQTQGFAVIQTISLGGESGSLTRLRVPEQMTAIQALAYLRAQDADGLFDFAHYFGLHAAGNGRPVGAAVARRPVHHGSATVGMIDTITAAIPAAAGQIEYRDFSSGSNHAGSHGVAVASILYRHGADRILAANVFSGSASGAHADATGVVRALGWLIERRVPVINISLAGPRNLLIDRLIARSADIGQIVVAAAGNAGPTAPPAYPAASQTVVAVTATDARNQVYRYAGRGSHLHFAARGVGVPAAMLDGRIALFTGTSFAAPYVTAVIAQCIERAGPGTGSLCVSALERRALDLGERGRDPVYGFGLVR